MHKHIRSDNGSEFTSDAVRKLLADLGKMHSALGYLPPAPEPGMPPALGELACVTKQLL
jgi:transposase InsO family protein